jgi:hypothetical protein
VEEGQGIVDIKLIPLCENQCIVHQSIKPCFLGRLVIRSREAGLGSVVEAIRCVDDGVFLVLDH